MPDTCRLNVIFTGDTSKRMQIIKMVVFFHPNYFILVVFVNMISVVRCEQFSNMNSSHIKRVMSVTSNLIAYNTSIYTCI